MFDYFAADPDEERGKRPDKYAGIPDAQVAVKDPRFALELFMESLWTNVVKTHNTVTIHTTPEIIQAITGYQNAIELETDYGTVKFEVTDFEDFIT